MGFCITTKLKRNICKLGSWRRRNVVFLHEKTRKKQPKIRDLGKEGPRQEGNGDKRDAIKRCSFRPQPKLFPFLPHLASFQPVSVMK